MKARMETLRRLEGKAELVFDIEGFADGLVNGLRTVMANCGLQIADCGLEDKSSQGSTGSRAMECGGLPPLSPARLAAPPQSGSKLPHSKMSQEAVKAFLDAREVVWREEAARIGAEIEEAARTAQDGAKADAVRARFNEIAKRRAPELAEQEIAAAKEMQNAKCKMQNENREGPSQGSTESRPTGSGVSDPVSQAIRNPQSAIRNSQVIRNSSPLLRRLIHPEVRVVDARLGVVDYVASDESIDSYKEVIRAAGWRFTHFAKNAPLVDSHDYSTIGKCLGKVIDFRVEGARLIERVQWAIDVPENQLAQIGWKMTAAGYLKAVSVGFFPVKYVTPQSGGEWTRQLQELGLPPDAAVRTIYTEQEQVELSCCVVGSNPNALAKAWQAGAINDADIETLSLEYSQRENGRAADCPAPAAPSREQAWAGFLEELQKAISQK
jgi:hypothetical protein